MTWFHFLLPDSASSEMCILTMYEELQIVRESESTEDDLKKRVKILGKTVEEAEELVSRKESELVQVCIILLFTIFSCEILLKQ